MIYLDNAATSFPKPKGVIEAMAKALAEVGASPGRGAYKLALKASRIVFETREVLTRFFGIENSADIIFTANGTEALNLGIKGLLKSGDHVVTSSVEHNSVTRPLEFLKKGGVAVTKAPCSKEGKLDPKEVEKALKPNTKLIVITSASNVTGTILPIEGIGKIAKKHQVYFMVDAAQSAGIFPLDVKTLGVDLLAFPGHKGLMGPPGTGALYIKPQLELEELKEGGTGGDSRNPDQPELRPERYESGTLNLPGIAGLGAALEFIEEVGLDEIGAKEKALTSRLLESLKEIQEVVVYGPDLGEERAPIVSFNIKGKDPQEVAFVLDQEFDVASRSGLHCAPDAHKTLGTLERGTARLSVGYFNTEDEVDQALEAIRKISKG